MRILLTGMMAGLPDEEYVNTVIAMGHTDHVPISYYNLLDSLSARDGKRLDRMMGATDKLFEALREREYLRIGMQLAETDPQHSIIHVPATIPWQGITVKMKDYEVIAEAIKPDIVVTLIDAEWCIRDRLMAMEPTPFRDQLIANGCEYRDILNWMNEEVSLAEDWAQHLGVRHYVIPVKQHPLSLYKLVKYGVVPSWYVSYSMTHADTKMRAQVNSIIKRLCEYGLVIDPQCIEIGKMDMSYEDRRAVYAYTVHRDLHWFVGKVDSVVAIHPYAQRPPLSTGMMDELGHARDYLLGRYMIFPPDHVSPFTSNSYIEADHVFQDGDGFFDCINTNGFRTLKFRHGVTEMEWAPNPLTRKD